MRRRPRGGSTPAPQRGRFSVVAPGGLRRAPAHAEVRLLRSAAVGKNLEPSRACTTTVDTLNLGRLNDASTPAMTARCSSICCRFFFRRAGVRASTSFSLSHQGLHGPRTARCTKPTRKVRASPAPTGSCSSPTRAPISAAANKHAWDNLIGNLAQLGLEKTPIVIQLQQARTYRKRPRSPSSTRFGDPTRHRSPRPRPEKVSVLCLRFSRSRRSHGTSSIRSSVWSPRPASTPRRFRRAIWEHVGEQVTGTPGRIT